MKRVFVQMCQIFMENQIYNVIFYDRITCMLKRAKYELILSFCVAANKQKYFLCNSICDTRLAINFVWLFFRTK